MDMEQNSFLAKVGVYKWILIIAAAVIVVGIFFYLNNQSSNGSLRVGISPYQDLAMTAAIEPLGLEEKYKTDIELVTLPWENIMEAVVGGGIDIGFASYIEYLTKADNINAGTNDPLVYVYPAYVFKGGAFVTFRGENEVPTLDANGLQNREKVAQFLSKRIGAQKSSMFDMMLYSLAASNNVPANSLKIVDTPLDQGFLAAEAGSLDAASVGLTQLTETLNRGGRSVFSMEDAGFADITGIVARKSVVESKKSEIKAFMKMWFDSVDYVYSDIDNNARYSLEYLDENASTKYTLEGYKTALTQEYLPRSVKEAEQELIDEDGKFSYLRIGMAVQDYILSNGIIESKSPLPTFLDI